MPINYDIDYPVLLRKYHELCNEFCGQRDAALKLADRLERFAYYRETDIGAAEYESGEAAAFRESAKYLHTIFAPKDGK